MQILVLPSPLLGRSTYLGLAEALGGAVADIPQGVTGVQDVLASYAEQAGGADLVVPHSNAGRFTPEIVRRTGARAVYVDAALPGETDPGFVARLEHLVQDDGLLPGWTSWWSDEEVDEAVGSAMWLKVIDREQTRLPLAFFTESVPTPDTWLETTSGYLAFGTTYGSEVDRVRAAGWPVRVADGTHLHHLHDPERVASDVLALAEQLD